VGSARPPATLTVLAAIRRGREAALAGALRATGDDIQGRRLPPGERPLIDFSRCRRIHFARFAILTDPDRGPGCARLLFASVYDGDPEGHLAELVAATADMDAIWGACEGYAGAAAFGDFVTARAHAPEACYVAFPGETVASIHRALGGRREPLASGGFVRGLRRLARALPIAADFVQAVVRFGFGTVYHATSKIVASLDRIAVFRFFNRLTRNRLPPRRSAYSSVALDNCAALAPLVTGDELPFVPGAPPPVLREDLVAQNELTLVTVVQPGRVDRVRAVLAAIDSYAQRLAPPGSLIGVGTIHCVRWLLIDGDRRLVLLSDYDNSWESYIDEFAEMILSGLDAIWETSLGYPPDGARDVPALKRFLRAHQVRAEAFYSAYPDATVVNIADATR
jgi:hypothetical protein